MSKDQIASQQPLNINMENTTLMKCVKCKSTTFSEGVQLRRISEIASPTGQAGIIPVPVFFCISCKSEITQENKET
jgi:hypothetical protein